MERTRRRNRMVALIAAAGLLQGCVSTLYNVAPGASNEAAYVALFPYYAEFCAVSEIRKHKDAGVDIGSGGPGGHSVLYLNGVCRVRDAGYPVVTLCEAPGVGDVGVGGAGGGDARGGDGVGISVNAHYQNANWTATDGRDFFFRGGLKPNEGVTTETYARVQAQAKARGVLDGVVFHPEVFEGKPADMSTRDYMYEVSVATDYAIAFGRDRYCARVPLDRARMAIVVDRLNAENTPYRIGLKPFEWSVLRNNCAHLVHNALAAVGVWGEWPIDRPLLISAFDFPVPKNEFVNLMRRTNDLPIEDPAEIRSDDELRLALLRQDWLATRPGGLAEAAPAIKPNALYETALRLIFLDEAMFGHYQQRFETIFNDPRYTDLDANLSRFAAIYARILAAPQPDTAWDRTYRAHISAEAAELDRLRQKRRPGTLRF